MGTLFLEPRSGRARVSTVASQSLFFATAEGRVLGTSRAISAAVRDLTGCEIEIVGKPSEHAITTAAHRLGVPTPELVVVGDDPELEIAMAHRGGSLTILVGPDSITTA